MRFIALVFCALLSISGANAALLATQTLHYSSRTALAAQSVTSLATGDVAVISEASNEGSFKWDSADHSADITTQGAQIGETYVAPNSDADGSSGAWIRIRSTAARTIFAPAGSVAAATVQAAVVELDGDIALKAPLASPAFTGTPTVPTAGGSDNSTTIANTAWAQTALALKANLASPTFTGSPAVPTAGGADDSTLIANTAWTRALVNTIATGTSNFKASAVVATTTNGTLASAFENGDTVNGVVLATGNRILIKDQSAGAENGIYTVNASGAPTRATDADSGAELVSATIPVIGGSVNPNTLWIQITPATITPGVTALSFTFLPQAGAYTAGNGLTLSANAFAADISDQATAEAGASNVKLMTPLRSAQFLTANLSDQATAEAGSNNTKAMTPLRTAQYVTATIADQSTAETGTSNVKLMTPLRSAQFLTINLSDQSTAEAGSNNTKVMTPLRSEQHFQAALDRTFDAISSSLPDKVHGGSGNWNTAGWGKTAFRFETNNAAQIAAGSIGTYSTMTVLRATKGQDTGVSPTAAYTDFGLVVQSSRGTGTDFLTDTSKGQQIGLQVVSFAPRYSDQGAMLWGIRRVLVPGTTEGATSGVEGNMNVVNSANAVQFSSGVQLGNFPDPTGSVLYINKGLGVNVTLEDNTGYPGYAAYVSSDRLHSGWENVLVAIENSTILPFFQITGRGNSDGGGAGAVRSGAGAASFPAYSKIGDIDTGFGFPAANQVGLYTNGTAQVTVTTANVITPLQLQILNGTVVPSGALSPCQGLRMFSVANLGIYFGSGPPSCTANKGSLYLNTTGSSSSTRAYINSTGSTAWVAITTAS